jgi:malonate-semialdehyde dehydrogenase (acetylating)/methylmalonate-semialdehyde dehydrogenase
MQIAEQRILPAAERVERERHRDRHIDADHAGLYAGGEIASGVAVAGKYGDTARDFASRVQTGMVGVNVPIPVPLAYYTFGGWKRSAFGDLNQHGPDSIRFYTKTKTVTSRWPSGVKDGASFVIPTMA